MPGKTNDLLLRMKAKANAAGKDGSVRMLGDRQFAATLCYIGKNGNGQELTMDEAKAAVANFRKGAIRMSRESITDRHDPKQHPRSVGEIVGSMDFLEIVEAEDGARLDFVATVYDTTEHARHAHQVIKDGLYQFDSYDIDYVSGECSACGKAYRSEQDICPHLDVVAGQVVGTRQGNAILRGVVIKGASMLEYPGAEKRARVKAVAHLAKATTEETDMSEPKAKTSESPAEAPASPAKVEAQGDAAAGTPTVDELTARVAELETENKNLTASLATYRDRERDAQCEAIVAAQEARGKVFDEKARKERIEALAGKSPEERATLLEMLNDLPAPAASASSKDEGDGDEDGDAEEPGGEAQSAKAHQTLRAVPDPDKKAAKGDLVQKAITARRTLAHGG